MSKNKVQFQVGYSLPAILKIMELNSNVQKPCLIGAGPVVSVVLTAVLIVIAS